MPNENKTVLSVVDLSNEDRQRGVRVGSEIGDYGAGDASHDWEEAPSGYAIWAKLMQRYLTEGKLRLHIEALNVVMWRWKKVYRRHVARFLETRASVEFARGYKGIAKVLLFYASAIAQGRDLDEEGYFVDGREGHLGQCRSCEGGIGTDDFTGKIEKTKPGDRFRWGGAMYKCPTCGEEQISRRLLPPNRHLPCKHT